MVFLAAGIYGLLLSVMIFSSIFTPVLVDLFVAQPYTLGSHGADWEYWQGTSCAFVGIVCLLARSWPAPQKLGIAWAIGFIYGVWGLQNLRLVLMTDRYATFMWLHVLMCLGIGAYGIVTAWSFRAASKPAASTPAA